CCLLLSETAALSLPWTGIEPGLPSLPILRSEPRSRNDRVRDQGGFCNIVGGVMVPPCGVPLRVGRYFHSSRYPALSRSSTRVRNRPSWIFSRRIDIRIE